MTGILVVCHCPSPNTSRLRDAAVDGMRELGLADLELRVRGPLAAGEADVRWCEGLLLGTTENFGYMAGLTKDFFERIYYPCLEATVGLPVAVYIRAGEDGRGTRDAIGRITTGLRWKYVADPLILRGDWDEAFPEQAAEIAMTLAAGLDAGVY